MRVVQRMRSPSSNYTVCYFKVNSFLRETSAQFQQPAILHIQAFSVYDIKRSQINNVSATVSLVCKKQSALNTKLPKTLGMIREFNLFLTSLKSDITNNFIILLSPLSVIKMTHTNSGLKACYATCCGTQYF